MKWRIAGAENPLYANEALWDAALGEFSGHSFGEASLNEILKTAGINKGSFYYRFNDKKDLYLSVFSRLADEKLELFLGMNTRTRTWTFSSRFAPER